MFKGLPKWVNKIPDRDILGTRVIFNALSIKTASRRIEVDDFLEMAKKPVFEISVDDYRTKTSYGNFFRGIFFILFMSRFHTTHKKIV